MNKQTIVVLDLGGEFNQLIARRIRECNVYCEVLSHNTPINKIKERNPEGIIIAVGDAANSPKVNDEIFKLNVPVLAIGNGVQMICQLFEGIEFNTSKINGEINVEYNTDSLLFNGVKANGSCWLSNEVQVNALPDGFVVTAKTASNAVAAMESTGENIYALQFYPEVSNTEDGLKMIKNFLVNICGCKGDWKMDSYAKAQIEAIREKVKDGNVLLAMSGGVDSSVCATLLSKAVGSQLTCIFVDTGLMRKDEGDEVQDAFKDSGMNFVRVNAQERFLRRLKGVTEPEAKRKAIGEEFIRVFEDEAKKIGKVDFLVQGTIYPDIIESGIGDKGVIKSHHNVGGLPDYVDFKEIIEPLRLLFKDEVRELGRVLGLADYLVNRQPFPGPGLGIRVIGEVTEDKLAILREADAIVREEILSNNIGANQYFAVLTNLQSVGVKNDVRTYDYMVAVRAVSTTDFMTADYCKIPYDVLEKISSRLVNEVDHINRVAYDITSKPPATIEWE